MNLLIKSISISLLSLLGMKTGLAEPGLGKEFSSVQYAGNPTIQSEVSPSAGRQYDSGSWEGQEDMVPMMQRDWVYSSSQAKPNESRLTPEQRQALRHEIRKYGRELYSRN